MNQKVSGVNQGQSKLKDSKSHKSLKATISPKLSSKHLAQKKVSKREKSDKKLSQVKSKKQIQLMSNYFDKDQCNEGEGGNYEYYNNQAHEQISRKGARKDKDFIQFSKSKQFSFQTESYIKTSTELKKIQSGSALNRLKLPQSKGVITFEGKYVKAPPEDLNKKYNQYVTATNSQYTDMFYGEKDPDHKKKKRKRQKSRNKTNEKKIKSKSRTKPHEVKKKLNEMRDSTDLQAINFLKRYRSKEKQECVDTQPSPGQPNRYSRKQTIDFDSIQSEIEKQKQKLKKINIQKNSLPQRMKSINMISKICGQLQFKKDTFALAVKFLDGYLSEQMVGTKMKIIAISSLILALKMEEAEMAAAFQFQIATANSCNHARQLRTSLPVSDRRSQNKSTSKKKHKKQEFISKINDKKNDNIYSRVTTLSYILLDEFGKEMISKNQLLQFENLITLKLNYKLYFKTNAYWVDLLTVIWDKKILNDYPDYDKLLFRCPKYRINMSYLLQILQILQYDIHVYNYSEVTLVLSVIYLLVRITMEEDPDGYEKYRKVLQKSSNALFVDNVGCNKLFGEYLQCLSTQMGQILVCCQFVSGYLLPGILKKHRLYGWADWEQNYDYALSIHSYNPELYRYCSK